MNGFGENVARFEKVSYEQYCMDVLKKSPQDISPTVEKGLREEYDNILLPRRATSGSAGYDFYIPGGWAFARDTDNVIYTGIRVKLQPGWVLAIVPRSGLGFKFGVQLKNTVGIIDSDYYNADNEGHIILNMLTRKEFVLKDGERFVQGLILPYGLCEGDSYFSGDDRTGGFGSTGR